MTGGNVPRADRLAVIALTRGGIVLAGRVLAALPGARLFAPEKFRAEAEFVAPGAATCYQGRIGDSLPALFASYDGLVAIFSLGALVRLLAPLLADKRQDPAVVVMDEAGRFAIPVLSGHLGGANELAQHLGAMLGATPVLTTASDVAQTLAVDLLGREFGWRVEADQASLLHASAAVVNGEAVAVVQEAGEADWWARHAGGRAGPLPSNLILFERLEQVPLSDFAAVLWISRRPLPGALAAALAGKCVIYRPAAGVGAPTPRFALGLGCDRDTPVVTLERAITEALARAGATLADVAAVASIDIKASEPAFAQVAAAHRWRIRFHSAEELAVVPVPNPSATVLRHTGTPSVSAAAALLAGGGGELLVEKHVRRGSDGRSATVSVVRLGHE